MKAVAYYNSVQDMLGVGLELLVDKKSGNIMAVFYYGSLESVNSSLSPVSSAHGCAETLILKEVA